MLHGCPLCPHCCAVGPTFHAGLHLLEVKETIRSNACLEMMRELHDNFEQHSPHASPLFLRYLAHVCGALAAWNAALA